jgi:hypothetical protein
MIKNNMFDNIDEGYQIIYLDRQIDSIIKNNIFEYCECQRGIYIFRVKQETYINNNIFQNCVLSQGVIDFLESESLVNITNNEFNKIDSYSIIGNNGWIENNSLSYCDIAIKVQDSIVYNNLIEFSDIAISAVNFFNIYNNDIVDNVIGIGFYNNANQNSSVFKNKIIGNEKGFYCITNNPPTIFYNNIFNNGIGIKNNAEIFLYAINNWWGTSNGPGGEGTGDGDSINGNILFDPWLINPVFDAGRQT